jgi:hypothetical protein
MVGIGILGLLALFLIGRQARERLNLTEHGA